MKCEYCGNGRVKDMPKHLEKNKQCREQHQAYLKLSFTFMIANHFKNSRAK